MSVFPVHNDDDLVLHIGASLLEINCVLLVCVGGKPDLFQKHFLLQLYVNEVKIQHKSRISWTPT